MVYGVWRYGVQDGKRRQNCLGLGFDCKWNFGTNTASFSVQIVRVVGRGRVSVISGLVHMRCIILGAAATYANLTSQVLNAGGVCVSEGRGGVVRRMGICIIKCHIVAPHPASAAYSFQGPSVLTSPWAY